MSDYIATIGIEIHVQLNTKSKMFCPCDNDSVNAKPNTHICPVCMGYPGTLPVANRRAIEDAIKIGLSLNAKITKFTKFDRKNYFYPDLPKGYQISQFDQPIVGSGYVEILIDNKFKKIEINRAHLEEDAAKLIHPVGADYSLVDFNRSGTPLVEIVSEPDISTPIEAKRYLQEIYNIVMSLGITNGDMEHGNFKFDLNVSVREKGQKELGNKVELKNLNSFRNAQRALTFEIHRQTELLKEGSAVEQETRGWDDAKAHTYPQRTKEESHDYRYFPEPDLPPLTIDKKTVESVKKSINILPIDVRKELQEIGLSAEKQDILVSQPYTAEVFNNCYKILGANHSKTAANWLVGDYQALLSNEGSIQSKLTGENLAELIKMVEDNKISTKIAKEIFADVAKGKKPSEIVEEKKLSQMSDANKLEDLVSKIIKENPQAKKDYNSGKQQALGFVVGQVMKQTKGQANPRMVNQIVVKLLNK